MLEFGVLASRIIGYYFGGKAGSMRFAQIVHLSCFAAMLSLAGISAVAGEAAVAPVKAEVRKTASQVLTARAVASEQAARFAQAGDLFFKAALASSVQALRAEKKKSVSEAEAAWADTAYLLEKAVALTSSVYRGKRALKSLKTLVRNCARQPVLAARASWHYAHGLEAAGNMKAARASYKTLGMIRDWQLIGPFDNERGQGFLTQFPPEKIINLIGSCDGKKRKVFWRKVPICNPDGLVDLAGMLRPNRQAVAYLYTCLKLKSAVAVSAAIRLASDDGVRVWLNGAEVWKNDVTRSCRFDQDVFSVSLRPGSNILLVKVAQSEGQWGLRLRLTDLNGAILANLTSESGLVPLVEVAADTKEASLPPVNRGALAYFAKRVRANPDDIRALYRLGYLSVKAGAYDQEGTSRPGPAWLLRAAIAAKTDPYLWYGCSFVSALEGRMQAETDENPRRKALEKSISLKATAAAELSLAHYYLKRYSNLKKTAQHLSRAKVLSPDAVAVRLFEAELALERGDQAEAFYFLKRLLKFSPDNPEILAAMAGFRLIESAPASAAGFFGRALKHDIRADLLSLASEAYESSGQSFKALETLAELLRRHPCSSQLRSQRARLIAGGGDYAAAVAECRRGLATTPENHLLLNQLADYQEVLGLKKEAAALRAKALKLKPNFIELQRYLEFSGGRPAFDRRLRENTTQLLKKTAGLKGQQGDRGLYILHKVIDLVNPDGTNSRAYHFLVKVLSDQGARSYASDTIYYYPGEQRIAIRTARVIRADGSRENAVIKPERVFMQGERRRAYRDISFPEPAVGDVIELEYRVDDLRQGFFGSYFGNLHLFQLDLPVYLSKYVLIVPAKRKIHIHQVRLKSKPQVLKDESGQTVRYTWVVESLKKKSAENSMPGLEESSPAVHVSTFGDWTAFGKWYWGLIRKQHNSGLGISKKVTELTAGCGDELSRIRAVYNFVVSKIRYEAWEFGVHGFKPYRAEQVLTRGFGDCKDKATLICSMLARIGIKAYPVLIRSQRLRQRQDFSLPLISHFNHCIVYLPPGKDRQEMWLDGTAVSHGIKDLPGSNGGARVAVITPEGALLRAIPAARSSANSTSDLYTLKLSAFGSGRGNVRLSACGSRSAVIRRGFARVAGRQKLLNSLHGRILARVTVSDIKFSELADLNVPVTANYSITIPEMIRKRGESLELKLPMNPLRGRLGKYFPLYFANYVRSVRREQALLLPEAWQHSAKWVLSLPAGWLVQDLPADANVNTKYGLLKIRRRFVDGRLTVEKDLSLFRTRIEPADYPAFRKFCLDVDRSEAIQISIIKGVTEKKPPVDKKTGGEK
jgi:tetratricopeptide (TPR) repeat protein